MRKNKTLYRAFAKGGHFKQLICISFYSVHISSGTCATLTRFTFCSGLCQGGIVHLEERDVLVIITVATFTDLNCWFHCHTLAGRYIQQGLREVQFRLSQAHSYSTVHCELSITFTPSLFFPFYLSSFALKEHAVRPSLFTS